MIRRAERLVPFATVLLCAAPLFVVTLKGWSSSVLFVGALLAGVLVLWGALPRPGLAPRERGELRALMLAMAAPVVSVAFAALLRGDGDSGQFDAPARLALAIPILVLVVRQRVDVAKALAWILPLSLAFTLAYHHAMGQPPHWPPDRMTTSFADPLVFGYLALAFALMCFAALSPADFRRGPPWKLALSLAGMALGLYLSVRSGSRTGWVAIPIVAGVWFHLHWGRAHRGAFLLGLVLACLAAVGAYLLLPSVHLRVNLAVREVLNYSWTGVAADTSVGMRITFLRIAAEVFLQHPLAGIGDTSHASAALRSFAYASRYATDMAFGAAFHNQIVSNAVRSGIFGLLATAAALLVPVYVCARQLGAADDARRRSAAIGFAFFTTMFVSSISTEVVDLKYMASFYAVMVALLCGGALAARNPAPP